MERERERVETLKASAQSDNGLTGCPSLRWSPDAAGWSVHLLADETDDKQAAAAAAGCSSWQELADKQRRHGVIRAH